jgi:NAD(P)-dependent dehydrogenase (short-subunit alcohol dehydrogenase family)
MSIVSLIRGRRGASGFGFASTAEEVTAGLDLRGKNILITGVNVGLGRETARVLSARGANVLGSARTLDKATAVCRELGASAVPLACELSEPDSVRACVAEVQRQQIQLDAVICNAGVMALPKREVRHGQELQFLTNHIGHFILVTGLLPQLTQTGRVVMVSSSAHHGAPKGGIQFGDISLQGNYSPWRAYGQSKLANLLFARSLGRRLAGSAKTANALHPGVIATELMRHMHPVAQVGYSLLTAVAFKDIPQGAATQCYVAVHPSAATLNGEFFADCNIARSSSAGRDQALADRLWTYTEEIVAGL